MESQSGDFGEEGLALGAPARLFAEPLLFLPQPALLLAAPRLVAVLLGLGARGAGRTDVAQANRVPLHVDRRRRVYLDGLVHSRTL